MIASMAFSPANLFAQSCTPSYSVNSELDQRCYWQSGDYANSKSVTWNVSFPDGYNISKNNSGSGGCGVNYTCDSGTATGATECYAYFDNPVTGEGVWSQTVQDAAATANPNPTECSLYQQTVLGSPAIVTTYTCQGNGQYRTSVTNHSCPFCNGQTCSNGACIRSPTPLCPGGSPEFCCGPAGGAAQGDGGCCPTTPIVIDTANEGFHLTNPTGGVAFSPGPNNAPLQISWTDSNYRNGWLALDRNGNNRIDDMTELFGNFTAQTSSDDPNGFKALAVFDESTNGGNSDGQISSEDSVYSSLRVWVDANHNGLSEESELYTLPEVGIFAIKLQYSIENFVDANGNQFRYRSSLDLQPGASANNVCFDVVLSTR